MLPMSLRRLLAIAALFTLAASALLAPGCTSVSGRGGASGALVLQAPEGRTLDPLQESAKPVVCLLLVRVDCPISNRYAPEVQRLAEAFADTADCWLVYSDPDETFAQIQAHVEDYGYPFGALRDPEQRLAARVGARVTPEVAVFGPARELVYVGRIDDRYVEFGRARPAATVRDLELVLTALAAGEAPPQRRTEAVGCPLPELLP